MEQESEFKFVLEIFKDITKRLNLMEKRIEKLELKLQPVVKPVLSNQDQKKPKRISSHDLPDF